ncbi:MAG: hypothetical protein NXI31_22415 [bacterium]|nr:hypothetical protein [bacterium]
MTCLRLGVVLATVLSAGAAFAQQTMTERMNAGFEKRAPQVGDELPDAKGFELTGEPYALRGDRGHLTVLVFGCLT